MIWIRGFWGAFFCIAFIVASQGNALAQRNETCDPRIAGFWSNLTCQSQWRRRLESRESSLHQLERDYSRLLRANISLRQEIISSEALIERLEKELQPSRDRIRALSDTRLRQDNYNNQVASLIRELEFLVRALNSANTLDLGCDTVAIQRYRRTSSRQEAVTRETIGFLGDVVISYGQGKLVDAAIENLVAEEYQDGLKFAWDIVSLIDTFISAKKRYNQAASARNIYQPYTEYKTKCG